MNDAPLIFDGHNDTLLNLYKQERGGGRSFFVQDERGHVDLPRAKMGRLLGGFFAMFVPPPVTPNLAQEKKGPPTKSDIETYTRPIEMLYAQQVTADLIELLYALESEADEQFKIVRTTADLAESLDSRVMAAVMHIEGAEAIAPDLSNLGDYYERGLRSLGITWSRSNAFAHGVHFGFNQSPDTGPGLTEEGKALVRACNEQGIMLDLSHLNEKGFWDVSSITGVPLVATHSGAHKICPSSRNLTDRQIDAIGESEGIIGINFHVGVIRPDGQRDSNTPVELIVRHVLYMADRIGVDYVALGSDFDGATMPDELSDASKLPVLMDALRKVGFNQDELQKIAHGNWLRVLQQTWS